MGGGGRRRGRGGGREDSFSSGSTRSGCDTRTGCIGAVCLIQVTVGMFGSPRGTCTLLEAGRVIPISVSTRLAGGITPQPGGWHCSSGNEVCSGAALTVAVTVVCGRGTGAIDGRMARSFSVFLSVRSGTPSDVPGLISDCLAVEFAPTNV